MSVLRFYWIDPSGHIRHPAEEIECASDADALHQAAEKSKGGKPDWSIEVWHGARCIGGAAAPARR